MTTVPDTQTAIQLVGPDKLRKTDDKPLHSPGPHQVLGKVEVVGLCFSDLKLLKQFDGHVRKSPVITGIDVAVLADLPGYVPGEQPTVPGHEVVIRVVAVGEKVREIKVGDRRLVQADYRWLKTRNSNAAFGYNFEGGLQEYVLVDERVITSPDGESMLMPADDSLGASQVALVEPWACVENSYINEERRTLKKGGRMLVAGEADPAAREAFLDADHPSAEVVVFAGKPEAVEDESIDDLVLFGADPDLLESLFPKVAANGLVLLVTCGQSFGRDVSSPVGRLHYGGVRIAGTIGNEPSEALKSIPATGEIREGDRIDVVGAGGPMGTMHVIRNLCQGIPAIEVYGGDMSDDRLQRLERLASPVAIANHVGFVPYNPKVSPPTGSFHYIALMVPVPALVADAIKRCAKDGIINIFAGIPAQVTHPLDLDTYVAKRQYFIGTSGSVIRDMKIVLGKVTRRTLDTNLSVAAVSGLDGAVDGIRAVENQTMTGKIIVYPSCKGLPLTSLEELAEKHPDVAAELKNGAWTAEAEKALIRAYE